MHPFVNPEDLIDVELITVPVSIDRLDVYSRFLLPANCTPRHHRTIEAPDLMLQLVAAGRGVTVLPDWLVDEEGAGLPIKKISLGRKGLRKTLNLGIRRGDESIDYRSEEHTSELQSLMRISYAVFCLKKKKQLTQHKPEHHIYHTPKQTNTK